MSEYQYAALRCIDFAVDDSPGMLDQFRRRCLTEHFCACSSLAASWRLVWLSVLQTLITEVGSDAYAYVIGGISGNDAVL